jgi:hypothetical protein
MPAIPLLEGLLEHRTTHVSFRPVIGSLGTSLRYPATTRASSEWGRQLLVKGVLSDDGVHHTQILPENASPRLPRTGHIGGQQQQPTIRRNRVGTGPTLETVHRFCCLRKLMLRPQSKIELEGKLKIPGVLTAGDIAEIGGRRAITHIWRGQVGMVEDVQEVSTELQALRFGELEVLLQT